MFNIFRKIAAGRVIDKKHYPAIPPKPGAVVGMKSSAMISPVSWGSHDGWSLIVQGTDKSGKHLLTKEIYVAPEVWGNTAIGDQYPPLNSIKSIELDMKRP